MQKQLASWLKLLHTVLCKTVLQCCELFLSWEEKSCQFCRENHKGNPLRERFSEWEQEANGTEANPRVSHSSLLCVYQRCYHKLTYLSSVNEQNSEMDIIQLKCFFPPIRLPFGIVVKNSFSVAFSVVIHYMFYVKCSVKTYWSAMDVWINKSVC